MISPLARVVVECARLCTPWWQISQPSQRQHLVLTSVAWPPPKPRLAHSGLPVESLLCSYKAAQNAAAPSSRRRAEPLPCAAPFQRPAPPLAAPPSAARCQTPAGNNPFGSPSLPSPVATSSLACLLLSQRCAPRGTAFTHAAPPGQSLLLAACLAAGATCPAHLALTLLDTAGAVSSQHACSRLPNMAVS